MRRGKLTGCRGTTEVYTDGCAHAALETAQVRPVEDAVAHGGKELCKVGPPKVGARLEFGEGVDLGTDRVEHDVLRGIHVELLREVGVDLEKLDTVAAGALCRLVRLRLERGQQRLEPFEGARVLADPDELDAAKAARRVGPVAQVPNVLQDRGPRGDADTGADEYGNLVIEDVLRGGAVGTIDPQAGHLLAILQGDLVHAHGVDALVQLGLSRARADGVAESSGKITDLAHVDGNIGIERARRDGERVPLVLGNGRDLEEEPLAGLVLEGRLVELKLDNVCE